MHSDILFIKTFDDLESAKKFSKEELNEFLYDDCTVYSTFEEDYDFIDYTDNVYEGLEDFLSCFKEGVKGDSYLRNQGFKEVCDNVYEFDLEKIEKDLKKHVERVKKDVLENIEKVNVDNFLNIFLHISRITYDEYGFQICDIDKYGLTEKIVFDNNLLKHVKEKGNEKMYFVPIAMLDYHF